MIVLRFMTDKWSLASWLIRKHTDDWCSHVEFYDTETGETLGSRFAGGVQLRDGNCQPFTRAECYTAPGVEEAWWYGHRCIGQEYDTAAIFGIGLGENWRERNKKICSEFVGWCFEKVEQPLLNLDTATSKLTPRDLRMSPFVRRVHVSEAEHYVAHRRKHRMEAMAW